MIYLEKIKVVKNTYPSNVLKNGFEIKCKELNLFVGNQGCGKSTMLKLLSSNHSDLELSLSDDVTKNGVSTFYFDTEKNNPRVNDPQLYTHINGQDKGIGYGGALASRFASHGEIMTSFVIEPLLKSKDCVIFIDEHESGLSITNQL